MAMRRRIISSRSQVVLVVLLMTLIVGLQMGAVNLSIQDSNLTSNQLSNPSTDEPGHDVVINHTHVHYLVWMFPNPPPNVDQINIPSDHLLICPYQNACKDLNRADEHIQSINLRDIVSEDSYFYNYIRDHAYHKVRHMYDFPYHIQAITMISLLTTNKNINNESVDKRNCVGTLGGEANICDYQRFSNYDPYDHYDENENKPTTYMTDLTATKYPYPFLGEATLGVDDDNNNNNNNKHDPNNKPLSLAPREILHEDNFAIWGFNDQEDIAMNSGNFNSGEDVQSYASASWLPFISQIRFKLDAIQNYTGYYISNSFQDTTLNLDEKTLKNMKKLSLLSTYIFDTRAIKTMDSFLRLYTSTIEPFGSRSTTTEALLIKAKIKTYFSACLTLTTNMQGAFLSNKASSHILNPILKPDNSAASKDKIIFVDVHDRNAVPTELWNSKDAIHLQANIAKSYPNCTKKMSRYGYSYKLLSTYVKHAKVLVTSRIHAGLPAAALGVPVIFIERADGWLPGGKQASGRVAGILDIFHRVEQGNEKNWTSVLGEYSDLSGDIPIPSGYHKADRYRASFWHRLKKTHFYEDTAKLFGMIPLQRLGKKNLQQGAQETFHLVLETEGLCWQTRRVIEHIFYFHPNCKVFIHSNDISIHQQHADLQIFSDTGYDLVLQQYSFDFLLKEASIDLPNDDVSAVPFLLLWKYGGVMISKNTLILKQIPSDLEQGAVLEADGSIAVAKFDPKSPDSLRYVTNSKGSKTSTSDSPSWSFPILSWEETVKCVSAEDAEKNEEYLDGKLAISLYPVVYGHINTVKYKSLCYEVIEKPCIFCDETHWEF